MLYRNYSGPRYTYQSLPLDLQPIAWESFYSINLKAIMTKPGTIDSRINTKYVLKVKSSLSLIKRMAKDYDYMLKMLDAKLVEFTAHGEYLNTYLETT